MVWHKKCQKVSKNETFWSISINREYVPKQETKCFKARDYMFQLYCKKKLQILFPVKPLFSNPFEWRVS